MGQFCPNYTFLLLMHWETSVIVQLWNMYSEDLWVPLSCSTHFCTYICRLYRLQFKKKNILLYNPENLTMKCFSILAWISKKVYKIYIEMNVNMQKQKNKQTLNLPKILWIFGKFISHVMLTSLELCSWMGECQFCWIILNLTWVQTLPRFSL